MKTYFYLKNRDITISLTNKNYLLVNQLLNAICLNLGHDYPKIIDLSVKVEKIYQQYSRDETLFERLLPVLSEAQIESVNYSTIGYKSEFYTLDFSNPHEKQLFIDKWFNAHKKITLVKGKLKLKLPFLEELIEFIRNSISSCSFNQAELHNFTDLLTLVESYDDELTTEVQNTLNTYLRNLREKNYV